MKPTRIVERLNLKTRNRSAILSLIIATIWFSGPSTARDSGYAYECRTLTDTRSKIVSFLEIDTDKIVNSITNGTIRMWDTHEWSAKTILVRSFTQRSINERPQLTSSMSINRETLEAVFEASEKPNVNIEMQCKKWTSKTRNK